MELKPPPPVVIKGIRFLLFALPLFFIGPSLIYNAFQNKENPVHYAVLAVGVIFCLLSMYFAFRGIKIMVDGLFDNTNKQHKK